MQLSETQKQGLKDLNESLNNLIQGILDVHNSSANSEEAMTRLRRAFRMEEPTGAEE